MKNWHQFPFLYFLLAGVNNGDGGNDGHDDDDGDDDDGDGNDDDDDDNDNDNDDNSDDDWRGLRYDGLLSWRVACLQIDELIHTERNHHGNYDDDDDEYE